MKTRIIHTRFWQDEFVSELSHKEKLLFMYLLTNDRVSLTGIYELPEKYIKADLELTNKEIEIAKEKFVNEGKFYFYKSWIKILNHDRFNNYNGEKISLAKEKELVNIPTEIREYVWVSDTSIDTSIYTPNNHKSKTIIHKSKIKNHNTPSEKMKEFIKSIEDGDEGHSDLVKWLEQRGVNPTVANRELIKFVAYWTELNKSGTKQRWELEKTFEVQKRLTTWFSRIKDFNKEKKGIEL